MHIHLLLVNDLCIKIISVNPNSLDFFKDLLVFSFSYFFKIYLLVSCQCLLH